MKKSIKLAAVAMAVVSMIVGSAVVANAEEYFAKPRLASNCDNVNCTGDHVSVWNASTGLNLYYCVPESWNGSKDEYRTKAEQYFAAEAGSSAIARVKDVLVSLPSKLNAVRANVTAAPVDAQAIISYFATHKPNNTCNNMNCKGVHIYVKNPVNGLDICYCVPKNWTASVDEYQAKLQEYMNLKASGEDVDEESYSAEVTADNEVDAVSSATEVPADKEVDAVSSATKAPVNE